MNNIGVYLEVSFKTKKLEKQLKDLQGLLDEEIEVDVYKVSRENIPQNISTKQVADILPMIKE